MRRASFILVASLLLVGTAWATTKPVPSVVQGRVVNSRGEAVPGAQVFIQSADGTAPHTFKTDSEGHFSRVVYARRGLYDVRAQAGGLWSEWQHNVSVKSSAKTEIVLTLVRTTPPALPH
jgi:Carboxypeptidase regulatory-like domain